MHSPNNLLFAFDGIYVGFSLAALCGFISENTVGERKECIITAETHVETGMNVSTSLAIDIVAGNYSLTVCLLGAKTL